MTIRPATPADAREIGTLNTRSWQSAYRGLLPDELLDGLDVEARVQSWERILSPGASRSMTFVAELEGRVAGFGGVGPSRDDDATTTTGEVWVLYIDPDYVWRGIGTQLFQHGLAVLHGHGVSEATLWVLEGNAPARSFYEKQGWWCDGAHRMDRRGRFELHEIRYRGAVPQRVPPATVEEP